MRNLKKTLARLALISSGVLAGPASGAPIQCAATQYTDEAKKDLVLTASHASGTASFAYEEPNSMTYVSADYTEGSDWVLLSIQVGNSGTAVDAAFRTLQGKSQAELIFSQYEPKTLWKINCSK